MLRRAVPFLLAVALVAPVARAQSVDDILAKHFEAQGGIGKLQKVQTVRMTGKMVIGPGMEAPVTMEKKRPTRQRMEFVFSGMTGVQAYDGEHAWQLMPFMGQKNAEPMSDEDAKEMRDQADFDGPLMDWKSKGHTLEMAGTESVEGADAYKLKLTRKSGQVEYFYIDTESSLMVKREAKQTSRGTELETETIFGAFKPVDGMMFPFSLTMGVKGHEGRRVMSIDSIAVNVPIEDSRFVMPAPPDTTRTVPPADTKTKPAESDKKK